MSKFHLKAIILLILLSFYPVNDAVISGPNVQISPAPALENPSVPIDSGSVPMGFDRNKAQAAGKASVYGPASGSAPRLPDGTDELLQYTAGGHVLGFWKGEMFVASGDHALRVEFVSARPVSPAEEIKLLNPGKNRDATHPLSRVCYRDLWDGVTLVYEKPGSGVVKSTYYIEPIGRGFVDPVDQIRLRYNVPVEVDASGNLLLSFATGEMKESRPVAWQEIEGKRVPVEAAYRLIGDQEVGFKANPYDSRYPLVIDPVLSWNTFLGSSDFDLGMDIAVDTGGNIYVAGESLATWGSPILPFIPFYAGDTFVAKLNGSGALQWNTFLGGGGYPSIKGPAIAVDTSGNVYVADCSYKTWGSPVRPFTWGGEDAFVAKLNGNGALQWNTFLGSWTEDYGYGIAVDTSGNVYVTGESDVTWGSPVRPLTEWDDAFVAKLNNNGVLQWNTFLGGSEYDEGNAIVVDTSGNVYIAGMSYKTWGSPVRPLTGWGDGFAAKLNNNGVLQWNTFLGGSEVHYGDYCGAIAIDKSGNVYVGGESDASWGSPVRPFTGNEDVFVVKLNNSGVLQWNTFLGGSDYDGNYGCIAVDKRGNVNVGGWTAGTWGSPVRPYAGNEDAFVAKLNGSGVLQWNTFLGGLDWDEGRDIAVDTGGNVYVAGASGEPWGSPIRPFAGGSGDAFVAKIGSVSKDDFVGTWDGQGVYYRNSDTGTWTKMASPANLIAVGDLDGDAIDDLIGIWPGQGGVWVKYSKTGAWA